LWSSASESSHNNLCAHIKSNCILFNQTSHTHKVQHFERQTLDDWVTSVSERKLEKVTILIIRINTRDIMSIVCPCIISHVCCVQPSLSIISYIVYCIQWWLYYRDYNYIVLCLYKHNIWNTKTLQYFSILSFHVRIYYDQDLQEIIDLRDKLLIPSHYFGRFVGDKEYFTILSLCEGHV